MANITLVEPENAGLFARLSYFFARLKVGRVPSSIKAMAHHSGVLNAYGTFELLLGRWRRVDPRLKTLASIRVASLVGCPF